jgi:hypothetical protein
MRPRLSVLCATAAGLCALTVSACGGSNNSSDQTRTIVETRTVTQPITTPTVTTSTGPLTNTTVTGKTTTQVSNACSASDLTPTYLGSNGAAGTIVLGFALKNTGSTICHTYGWPGVQFLSSSGGALPTGSVRTTGDVVGSTPATVLALKPGGEASFRVVASDMGPNGSSCPTASYLQIYAPDDTVKMKVSVSGVAACGKSTVSPLMAGASAFAGQGGAGQTGIGGSSASSGSGVTSTNGGQGLSSG